MDALLPEPPLRLGLAVSGGGDSMALMDLACGWAKGVSLHVATVDHGLRAEAAQEAAQVAQAAQQMGLSHDVLTWQGWDGCGNLQDAARQARRRLLADWAKARGIDTILLGHTQDDQAETFLMRLARGSGVDGLSAMAPARDALGITWLRPLIGVSRDSLRAHLRARGCAWVDDPSNDNPAFDRIKARQMLDMLAPLGLTPERLVATAARMSQARDVLQDAADHARATLMTRQHGDILFARAAFDALRTDTQSRLLADALCEVASSPYRPRYASLTRALSQSRASLHGCLITRNSKSIRVSREYNAVRDLQAPLTQAWDNRWHITAPQGHDTAGHHIAALGAEGLAQCPRPRPLPHASLLASPAVWQGTRLIAAPLAGFGQGWQAVCDPKPR